MQVNGLLLMCFAGLFLVGIDAQSEQNDTGVTPPPDQERMNQTMSNTSGPGMCEYTECMHGGQCKRVSGFEWCSCENTGFGGLFCEVRKANCTEHSCNNGTCTQSADGLRYCTCTPSFSGVDCENLDSEARCANVSSDDMMFLPQCSLRTSLTKLSVCINKQLPYLNDDPTECTARITKTKHCIYNVIANCSHVACNSIYEFGAAAVYGRIAEKLYDPLSNFSKTLDVLMCSLPQNESFTYPEEKFNIGEPVCEMDLMDRLVKSLIDYGNSYLQFGHEAICRELNTLKLSIYNITKASCNWSKIGQALPTLQEPERFQKLLEFSHEFFLHWFVPGCEGTDGGSSDDMCPMITSASSQHELQDAWMCELFNYKKTASAWMNDFMTWWRGCSGFTEINWNQWAQSMNLNSANMYLGRAYGEVGFVEMVKANAPCSGQSRISMECFQGGREFIDALGCRNCFRRGATRNPRSLFVMWMQEHQHYMKMMKIYNALRKECPGSSTAGGDANIPTTSLPWFTGFESTSTSSMHTVSSSGTGSTFSPHIPVSPHSPTQTVTGP